MKFTSRLITTMLLLAASTAMAADRSAVMAKIGLKDGDCSNDRKKLSALFDNVFGIKNISEDPNNLVALWTYDVQQDDKSILHQAAFAITGDPIMLNSATWDIDVGGYIPYLGYETSICLPKGFAAGTDSTLKVVVTTLKVTGSTVEATMDVKPDGSLELAGDALTGNFKRADATVRDEIIQAIGISATTSVK